MERRIKLAFIFLSLLLAAYMGLAYYYYTAPPMPRTVSLPTLEGIRIPLPPLTTYTARPERGGSRIVVDMAHENAFTLEELSTLLGKLVEAGAEYEVAESSEELMQALRGADAAIIISPSQGYGAEETALVKELVEEGGRVALFKDPTRPSRIESIASQLGVAFTPDYLYNTRENAGNYRHILIKDFKPTPVTTGLEVITFDTASSIAAPGGIAYTSEHTVSSLKGEGVHPVITLVGGSVLAFGDQSFLHSPMSRFTDNERLISNTATYLAQARRRHRLDNFPFYIKETAISYSGDELLDEALTLKEYLVDAGVKAELGSRGQSKGIFIGLLNESEAEMQELGGVISNNTVIAGGNTFDLNRTAIFYMQGSRFWLLSNEEKPIADLIAIIREGRLKHNLVSGDLAVLPYEPTAKEETAEAEGNVTASSESPQPGA